MRSSRSSLFESNSLQILWNEVNCLDRNGPIEQYTVVLTRAEESISVTSSARQITIDDLIPNQEYSVRVAAANSAGTGPFSEAIIVVLVREGEYSMKIIIPRVSYFRIKLYCITYCSELEASR